MQMYGKKFIQRFFLYKKIKISPPQAVNLYYSAY